MTDTNDRREHDADTPPEMPFDGEPGRLPENVRVKRRLTRAVCLLEAAEIVEINESVMAENAGRKRSSSAERVAEYRRKRRERKEREVGGVYAPDDEAARELLRKIGDGLIKKIITLGDLEGLFNSKPNSEQEDEVDEEKEREPATIRQCRAILDGSSIRRILFRLLVLILAPRAAHIETES